MRKLAVLSLLLIPFAAGAQDLGVRASAEADYKLSRGLHISLAEEARGDLDGLGSLRTTLNGSYKLNKYVKFGLGYTMINPYSTSSSAFKEVRHRFFADVSGSYKQGSFSASLRERLMMTHRTGEYNVFQTTPYSLALRSRFTVKYKLGGFTPYAYYDLKTILNDPWGEVSGSIQKTEKGKSYYAYTHSGYTHAYNSRHRFCAGVDIKLSSTFSVSPFAMFDICSDYVLDTNGDGTKFFIDTSGWEDYTCAILGINCKINF